MELLLPIVWFSIAIALKIASALLSTISDCSFDFFLEDEDKVLALGFWAAIENNQNQQSIFYLLDMINFIHVKK